MAGSNVLSAQSLASIIAQVLPPQSGIEQQLKNSYDAVAIAAHAAMLAVGFRLVGLSEDDRLPGQPDFSTSALSPSSKIPYLPTQWNEHSPANHSFRYAHSQSAMQYLVKLNRLGTKAIVMGMGIGHDRTASFEVKVDEYISPSSLPASPAPKPSSSSTTSTADNTSEPNEPTLNVKRAVTEIFISQGRLSDFAALFRLNLIQKLLPSLQKEGYEETATSSSSAPRNQRQQDNPHRPTPTNPYPHNDPLAMPRRNPLTPNTGDEFAPPGFEDEFDILRQGHPRPPHHPIGQTPFAGVGQRDLYPAGLGPNDPFRNTLPPGGGIGGGGMHPTFDDPLFAGQGSGRPGGPGGDVGGGLGGFDGQRPPGARWDPTGPGMGGGPRGGGFGGGFGGGGGGFL